MRFPLNVEIEYNKGSYKFIWTSPHGDTVEGESHNDYMIAWNRLLLKLKTYMENLC